MNQFFNPKTSALIGASEKEGSVGRSLAMNLINSKTKTFFVNPNKKNVLNKKCYNRFFDIKEEIDLAIIAVPAKVVLKVAQDIVKKGAKGVIVISAGFLEVGEKKRQEDLKNIFNKANIRFIGPNSLGVISPGTFNGSFAPFEPKKGSIAFLSQSGALIDSVIDQSLLKSYNFSHLVSYGNGADLEVSDFLKYLDNDKNTKSIAIYLESLKDGRKFIKTVQEINTPVVVLKGGKTKVGSKAVSSHTGSLAGKPEIYSAAFKKAGAFEVSRVDDLFIAAQALSFSNKFKGDVGIVTNGGAVSVLLSDWLFRMGINLSKISDKSKKELKSFLRDNINIKNPLDILGDALTKTYKKASLVILKNSDALVVLQTPQMMTDIKANAQMILSLQKEFPKKTIIAGFIGGKETKKGIDILKKGKVSCFSSPYDIALALKALKK